MSAIRVDPLEEFECTVHELQQRFTDPSRSECWTFPHDNRRAVIIPCAGDTVHFGPALFVRGLVLRLVRLTIEDSHETHSCVAVYGFQQGPKRRLTDGSWSVRVRPSNGDIDDEQEVLDAVAQAGLLPNSYVIRDVVRLIDLGADRIDWYSCDPLVDLVESQVLMCESGS